MQAEGTIANNMLRTAAAWLRLDPTKNLALCRRRRYCLSAFPSTRFSILNYVKIDQPLPGFLSASSNHDTDLTMIVTGGSSLSTAQRRPPADNHDGTFSLVKLIGQLEEARLNLLKAADNLKHLSCSRPAGRYGYG